MAFNSYLTVALLVIINLINYMDRFTIAGVLGQIQDYFEINDATSGLLQTAFICSYMIFSPLFGFLGDRYSRKYLIIFGVSFWSAMTLLSSFVRPHHTYLFFMFRALVGIGEASYATIAPTLIADLFIGAKRSTMLAVFYFAIPVGSGLGYIVGIAMAKMFNHWTYALRFTPVFGFLSVIGFWFVKEPRRGEIERSNQSIAEETINQNQSEPQTIRSIIASLKGDICYLLSVPTYIYTTFGFTCVCFSVGALSWWAPTFMQYANTQTSKETIGFIFGVIACLGGLFGVLLGYGCSRYFRSKYPTADAWVCGVGVLLSIPFGIIGIALARTSTTVSWFGIFFAITFLSTNWSVCVDILLYVIVPKRRSTAQALQILTAHILGDATSPFIIGAISDSFGKDLDKYYSLSYALYLTPIILVLGFIFFALSSYYLLKDEHKCKQMISGSSESNSGDDTRQPPSSSPSTIFAHSDSTTNLINQNIIVNDNLTMLHQRSPPTTTTTVNNNYRSLDPI